MDKFYFFGIIQFAIEETDLTRMELKILCKIANLPRGLQASQSWLAKELDTSRVTVNKGLQKLIDLKLIEKDEDAYRFTTEGVNKTLQGCKENFTGGVKKTLQKVLSKVDSTTNILITNIGDTKESISTPAPDQDPDLLTDKVYLTTGKKPLKNYPAIWLSDPERDQLEELYKDLDDQDVELAFIRCEQQDAKARAEGRDARTSHAIWLMGFIYKEILAVSKGRKDLARSNNYLKNSWGN